MDNQILSVNLSNYSSDKVIENFKLVAETKKIIKGYFTLGSLSNE